MIARPALEIKSEFIFLMPCSTQVQQKCLMLPIGQPYIIFYICMPAVSHEYKTRSHYQLPHLLTSRKSVQLLTQKETSPQEQVYIKNTIFTQLISTFYNYSTNYAQYTGQKMKFPICPVNSDISLAVLRQSCRVQSRMSYTSDIWLYPLQHRRKMVIEILCTQDRQEIDSFR